MTSHTLACPNPPKVFAQLYAHTPTASSGATTTRARANSKHARAAAVNALAPPSRHHHRVSPVVGVTHAAPRVVIHPIEVIIKVIIKVIIIILAHPSSPARVVAHPPASHRRSRARPRRRRSRARARCCGRACDG
ncbi:hypothetical protein BE221DRAFT_72411 [Ostreococcus tauri]|uniref:Uncharacterized protein n=1 Tax=Ostreococcus tauri TaxID=70448 RepID=A0A1Y5IEN9_OSTTA|nr:hypothetical protein BE221DRAFT_72411 [Ostreococcus tauri]